jgi:hypothetical protein
MKNGAFANLILYCFIIIENMDTIENYPNTLSLQLSSRICNDPFVTQYESESVRTFSLFPLYSYDKFKTKVKTVHVDNRAIRRLIYSLDSPCVFVLTENNQVKLVNHNSSCMLGKLNLDLKRIHDDDIDFKIRICLCARLVSSDTHMSDINGLLVLFNLNFIKILNFKRTVVYEYQSHVDIDTVFILSPRHILLCFETSLQIIDVVLKIKVYESQFETAIDCVDSNVNSHIVYAPDYRTRDLFILVTLVTGVIEIYRFATETVSLVNMCIIPSFNSIDIISLVIDDKYFIDSEPSKNNATGTCLLKFATLLQNYSICTYTIDKQGVKYKFNFENFLCPLVLRKYMNDTARIMDFKHGLLLLDCGKNENIFTISDMIIIFHIGLLMV